ncbi:uncharacterized protein LOC121259902 isoform X1 [Juglans microcarpa x Juglans regia]|uniref:uncharacterized protein LOC121259902 isoform X1 n=1 Tax=Juglans microcarpa x Juglans regia TaxID=2249226 RepID=UPI001B7F1649|nr:uncharacterized protein LOC121259902 isoform X1 [Juglans microcarpa x Juglans regia]
MAATASVPKWIPEDDVLLKNALEGGASLEALAKGAVRFSRRFTVRELRDRWRSLLYDNNISAEASARMVEYELSASGNSSSASLRNKSVVSPAKRKADSVREHYYAMRKKLCNHHAFQSFDLSFLGSLNEDDRLLGNGSGCQAPAGSSMIVDGVESHLGFQNPRGEILNHVPPLIRRHVDSANAIANSGTELIFEQKDSLVEDFGNSPGAEDIRPPYDIPDMPIWKTIEDVSAPAMPISMSPGGEEQCAGETMILPGDVDGEQIRSSVYHVVHSEPILKDGNAGGFVDLSDCLLNLANEDELPFADEDAKDASNKPCCFSDNSIPLSCLNYAHEDDVVPDVCEPQTLVLNAGLDAAADSAQSGRIDRHSLCSSEVGMTSSTSVPDHLPPELHDGEMECTLNTEDPEIPCNDHICLSTAFAFTPIWPNYKETTNPSSSTHQTKGEREINLKKKDENSSPSLTRMVALEPVSETRSKHPIVGSGAKPGWPDGNHLAVDSQESIIIDPSQLGRSTHATPKSAMDGALKIKETNASELHARPGSTQPGFEPEANPPTLDQEESDDDDDVPSFFDIEAMILEMDLCPDDQDPYVSREVLQYQHQDTKRKIIRLEQCARSSMQRAIASRGALAIMYGRHLKHYIRKTEVILGRATNDFEVDIDLGREGLANKVSRRQALIKMEEDGSFFLKNLGKSSIFLNGKEVSRGQLLRLNTGSLIEIREMAFVFEMNHKSVRRYLVDLAKRSQENTKFEWSSEGGP